MLTQCRWARGRCYVKSAALQLSSSKDLLSFVAGRAVGLQLCLFQPWCAQRLFWLGLFPVHRSCHTLPGRALRWHWVLKKQNATTQGVLLGTHCSVHVALACPFPRGGFGGCRSFPCPCSCNLSPLGLYINYFTALPPHLSETWSAGPGCVA